MFRSDRKVCSDPRKQPAPQHGRPRSVGAVCPMPVPALSAVPPAPRGPSRFPPPFSHTDLLFQRGADE